jgi:ribosome biogenesis protein BRX1
MYFEPRRSTDLYCWIGKYPHGPSAKFQVKGINIAKELKLTGNCLKGSRPVLSFDGAFNPSPEDCLKNKHLVLLKELFTHVFGTPQFHPKSKPFVDHVFSFKHFDERIWFRNYQIMNAQDEKFTEIDQVDDMNLVEIGRLTPY